MVKSLSLSSIVAPADVLDAAFALPVMRINPRGKKRPTLEQAQKACINGMQATVIKYIEGQFGPVLAKEYAAFVKKNGYYEAAKNKDTYESKQDEMVEEAIEPYTPYLSQDWLAQNTIGSGLHLPNGVQTFVQSLGKGYYKELTHGKTPGDILSSVGLTTDVIEARYQTHINPTEKEKELMADQQEQELDVVLRKIAEHIGPDHDAMTVYDDLDFASDDDEGLAAGAAARLGIDADDLVVLQGERLVHGADVMDILHQGIQSILDGSAKPKGKGKGKKAAKEPKTPKSLIPAAPKAEAAPKQAKKGAGVDVLDASVLSALKEAGGLADTEAATNVGVSRQTYINYLSGKSEFKPNPGQLDYVRGVLVDKANRLLEALALVDGDEEPHTVF